ncbi:bifunctional hydroxymethylpyrimidine kinase/phosphomethylpyrimidine kinase [Isosphaeraceae bacterium EP7]
MHADMTKPPACLAIGGSDSSGGAGIQADLKTFAALGTYGASAIAALTAQNTNGVQGVLGIPAAFVRQQVESVLSDLPIAAIKVGMLGDPEVIQVVAALLANVPQIPVVIDPVCVSRGGDSLIEPGAWQALRDLLLPLATVATPNRHELALLAGTPPVTDELTLRIAGRALAVRIGRPVLAKGGSALPEALDLLILPDGQFTRLTAPDAPIPTRHTHGAGCTLAAAIAAYLAKGLPLPEAALEAKRHVTGAIRHAPGLGSGHGPVNHAWNST